MRPYLKHDLPVAKLHLAPGLAVARSLFTTSDNPADSRQVLKHTVVLTKSTSIAQRNPIKSQRIAVQSSELSAQAGTWTDLVDLQSGPVHGIAARTSPERFRPRPRCRVGVAPTPE